MSITDDIRKSAKENLGVLPKEETEENKVLPFRSSEEDIPYRAFHAPLDTPLLRFKIASRQMILMPRYDLLYDVIHTGLGDFVGLIFPHVQVKLFGRNLIPLVNKLSTHSVEWIQEYVPPIFEFAEGEDDGTLPCVEQIVIENVPLDPMEEIRARNNS